jgi:polyribonucleotide nucleotidyltransferase
LSTQLSHTLRLPKEHHRYFLGKAGKKLQELEKVTGTKITIPRQDDKSDEVRIIGTKEGVEKAVHELRIISDEQSKQAYERMEVPKKYHPFIAGGNNRNANQWMSEYNVRINIPPNVVMKDEITVAGDKDGVLAVVDRIKKLVNDLEKKCTTVSVEVKKSQHKYVIGPKGTTIAEILEETGVSVEMPPSDSPSGKLLHFHTF